MKGILVYNAQGVKRNEWYINKLKNGFKPLNVDLQLVVIDNEDLQLNNIPDFAIVRVIAPNINKRLEDNGVRVFNNYLTSGIANDKWQTYLMCRKLGIPVLDTRSGSECSSISNYPCIVKSIDGCGGKEVFMANNSTEYGQIAHSFKQLNKRFIIQRPCSEQGKDMRLYMLGGQVVASILRHNPNNFKSNYSLGGNAQKAVPTDYQIEIAAKIYKYLKCDYVGVDFIIDNGKWVLNEIEDVVGARMLYANTDIDIAEKYVRYIIFSMLNK